MYAQYVHLFSPVHTTDKTLFHITSFLFFCLFSVLFLFVRTLHRLDSFNVDTFMKACLVAN